MPMAVQVLEMTYDPNNDFASVMMASKFEPSTSLDPRDVEAQLLISNVVVHNEHCSVEEYIALPNEIGRHDATLDIVEEVSSAMISPLAATVVGALGNEKFMADTERAVIPISAACQLIARELKEPETFEVNLGLLNPPVIRRQRVLNDDDTRHSEGERPDRT